MDLDVRSLPLKALHQRLVNHDFRIGQRQTLALRAAGQQERTHGGCHAHTNGGHIALDVFHRVVNGHTGRNGTTGAVDIQADVLVRILAFQIQQLGYHQAGGAVVYFVAQHNDAIVQQTGKNVIGTLTASGLFHHVRYQTHEFRLLYAFVSDL